MRTYDFHNNATGDFIVSLGVPDKTDPLQHFADTLPERGFPVATRAAMGDVVEVRKHVRPMTLRRR